MQDLDRGDADGIDGGHLAGRRVIVFFDGTFIHLRNGAHVRMASLLRYLLAAGCSVTLFSFANHPTEPWTEAAQAAFRTTFPSIRLVLDERSPGLRRQALVKTVLMALAPDKARAIAAWRRRGASPNYEALVDDAGDAVWIVNYSDGVVQLNGLPAAPIVLETHDVRFINIAKKAGAWPFRVHTSLSARSLLRMRSEIAMLDCVAALIAIAPSETGFFRTLLATPEVFYVPQYEQDLGVHRADPPPGGYRHDLVFVGSAQPHNVRGLGDFLSAEAPRMGALRIAVAGEVGFDPRVRALAEPLPNVDILGFVDDLAGLYAASKAALSPVDGTGLKIKAVEALGHGRPVFASRHSMDGLAPGYDRCVFPIDPQRIERLLSDDAALGAAQAAAIAYWQGLAGAGDLPRFRRFLERGSVLAA